MFIKGRNKFELQIMEVYLKGMISCAQDESMTHCSNRNLDGIPFLRFAEK